MKSNECDISILFKEVILDPSKNISLLAFWLILRMHKFGKYFFFLNVAKVWNDYEIWTRCPGTHCSLSLPSLANYTFQISAYTDCLWNVCITMPFFPLDICVLLHADYYYSVHHHRETIHVSVPPTRKTAASWNASHFCTLP